MIKKILLILAIFVLQACSGTKGSSDKLIGESKTNLIKIWGTPIRTLINPEQGEVLIYAEQVYANAKNEEGSRIAGPNYWNYTYVYVNEAGKIYSYKTDTKHSTPQEIAVK